MQYNDSLLLDKKIFVLVEAMFRGIQVISTICGGPEEVVTPQTCLLCLKGDASALAATMDKMRRDYSAFNPVEIRNHAILNYSVRNGLKKVMLGMRIIYFDLY